ncbi:hypothetical protein [Novosphingobium sp. 9U]|uniref:hypothetical protein n=1 Tax=Novosphingobium sp. 9U TaxID=2653158 RepID=UPI001F1C50B1|nr:hypothetical protein [Novosphingobium sp. 9U]
MANGRVQLEGAPRDLIESTRGRVWQRTIDHDQLDNYKLNHEIISHRFFAGRVIIHVLSDERPDGFDPVQGGLEDVYFATLASVRRPAVETA